MFIQLVLKELKHQFKSITIYMFLGIVLLFYFTQFAPPDVNTSLEPLDEMHFMYKKMLNDYNSGKIINRFELERLNSIKLTRKLTEEEEQQEKAAVVELSVEQKKALTAAIDEMNPGGLERNEAIAKISFKVTYDEYKRIFSDLDQKLGGNTYYGDNYREQLLSWENRYGSTELQDPVKKMRILYSMMNQNLSEGKVLSYKLGLGKEMHLSNEQKELIKKSMAEMLPSGTPEDNSLNFGIPYEEFIKLARNLDKALGGGTYYGDAMRESLMTRPQTYSEAKKEFDTLLEKDKITRAFGRVFADYSGITAGFFPVFLSAFILTRDRRNRMHELIYSKAVSSSSYVISKFTAVCLVCLLCYLISATHATFVFARLGNIQGYSIDFLAFYKYTFAWIFPTIMFSAALGMFLSIVFGNGVISIPVQLILWFVSLMPLYGDYRLFKPVIRFNILGSHEKYISWFGQIATNRIFYIVLSVIIVILTSKVLSWRRVSGYGGIHGLIKNRKI